MSWLSNSFPITDDSEPSSSAGQRSPSSDNISANRGIGVKEEFPTLGQTIGRQLRGVAAFLAPPPSSPESLSDPVEEDHSQRTTCDSSSRKALVGVRNDLAEIGGNLKSGLSRLSSLLQFTNLVERDREGTEFDEVPGISEEVVDFAKEISARPGFWIDFPLSLDIDFEMSDVQRAHASAIEHLVPSLVAIKDQVGNSMDDEQFWLIYFILLLPRLQGQHDLELLATHKVVETRDRLLLKLQQNEAESSNTNSIDDETSEDALHMKHKESCGNKEDISFSDLEAEDYYNDLSGKPLSSRNVHNRRASSASSSSDWVQLNKSPGGERPHGYGKDSEGESSDWLAVTDSD